MDSFDLLKEQQKLAPRIQLNDGFTSIKKVAGIDTLAIDKNKLIACVVVCEFPSFKILEQKSYTLHGPLPYKPGFSAYREMPAMIEAYNLLEEEPDVILVKGEGILHPRRIGLASHLGLILNKPTIGVLPKLPYGKIEKGKIIFHNEMMGFEVTTREHANPVYVSPGHLITFGSALDIVSKSIIFPHKLPEPLHLVHKMLKKGNKKSEEKI